MTWEEICQQSHTQWDVIEAIAWPDEGERRTVTEMIMLETFADNSLLAQRWCNDLLATMPERQLYFTYTGWDSPRIKTPIQRIRTPRVYPMQTAPLGGRAGLTSSFHQPT